MLPDFITLLQRPIQLLALGFGSGLSPKAPGTVGTLAAVPLYLLIYQCPVLIQFVIVFIAFVIGIWLCEKTATALGVHDHPGIVWDEFVGFWLTMLVIPLSETVLSWQWLLVGFLLFRLFDIVKPWPIRWVDSKVGGGFGIMFDDVLAGFYAGACLWAVVVYWG